MRVRKLLIFVLLLSLWGGSMMFADSAAQRVRVFVNSLDLQDRGMLVDGLTYLPLRQVANSLQALITWDDNTRSANIYKPNVHMFVFKGEVAFGKVKRNSRHTFNVMAQVDNLQTTITAIKVAIADPNGKEEVIQSQDLPEHKDNFWFNTKEIKYSFDAAGNYPVRFYMKQPNSDDWRLVSEKLIIAE